MCCQVPAALPASFAARWGLPQQQPCHAQDGLEEAETFCKMMVTNTIEDLLEPSKRAQLPCGFNYKRLAMILAKYRCISACVNGQSMLSKGSCGSMLAVLVL